MSRPQLDHLPERRVNALPHAFKCAMDGEWHGPDMFSKNQISKWMKKKKFANDGVTPENIGLVCKKHSQQPIVEREIKCHGPCGAWKHKEHFSKNQRNQPDAWCTICSSWASNFGGDEIPNAAPGEALQAHEILAQTTTIQGQIPSITDTQAAYGTIYEQSRGSTLGYQNTYRDAGDDNVGNVNVNMVGAAMTMMRYTPFYDDNDGIVAPSSMMFDDEDFADDVSVASLTSHSKLKDEMELLRGSGMASRPVFRGRTMSITSHTRLYTNSPFRLHRDSGDDSDVTDDTTTNFTMETTETADITEAEDNTETENSTANITTPKAPETKVVRRLAPIPAKKWFKPDSRKVFYAPQTYAARPADNTNIRGPIEDSDDEDVDF
ncbi:hypothetical protein F4776DRAFT_676286 [Hypoxylon sp. NC0597]|nr:hypothetical protein F4776DRAFT_676286 [Hypoxylon sp. NC0597]